MINICLSIGRRSSYGITNSASVQAQISLSPSITETVTSQPPLGAPLARQAAKPALQSFNLCKPGERVRALQSRTLQSNCWLYPFCANHRHLSIKRNKFRHCQFVPTFCSSALIWFVVLELGSFLLVLRGFYFCPNQHKVVVPVKIWPFYFNIWL